LSDSREGSDLDEKATNNFTMNSEEASVSIRSTILLKEFSALGLKGRGSLAGLSVYLVLRAVEKN